MKFQIMWRILAMRYAGDCLKAESIESDDVALHPTLVEEWKKFDAKRLI